MTYSTQARASSAVSKVIQIASAENRLYALTEDGEIWLYDGYDSGWEQLPHPEPRPPKVFVFRDRREESA